MVFNLDYIICTCTFSSKNVILWRLQGNKSIHDLFSSCIYKFLRWLLLKPVWIAMTLPREHSLPGGQHVLLAAPHTVGQAVLVGLQLVHRAGAHVSPPVHLIHQLTGPTCRLGGQTLQSYSRSSMGIQVYLIRISTYLCSFPLNVPSIKCRSSK